MVKTIQQLIEAEEKRQQETLSLIASENIASSAVRQAVGSVLMNKYSEGYPGKRYYGGNEIADEVENRAIELAKKLFGAEHANVQAYSGSPANIAVYTALANFGDTIMGMSLAHGGHLTHGHKVSFSGKAYKFIQYGVDPSTGLMNYDEIETMAKIFKPKIIVCGATAYPREIDFARFGKIAKQVGAYLLADISHIAGLIAGGVHPHPFPHADVVMTTTHKTLRGPRGAIIMCKKPLASLIDKAIFPGLQGGPHDNITAAKAICFEEASKPEFKKYARQIVDNATALSANLTQFGFKLVSGGTDNHLMLIDLSNKKITGMEAEQALESVGIITNKNMIPGDLRSPFDPSGLRLGVTSITTRGMTEPDMAELASIINDTLANPTSKSVLSQAKKRVAGLCQQFPVPD